MYWYPRSCAPAPPAEPGGSETIDCPVCGISIGMVPFTDNARESGVCLACGSFNRQRQLALVLLEAARELRGSQATSLADHRFPKDIRILSTETWGAVHAQLQRLPGYTSSEYYGPQHASGDLVDGKLHQDLMATSFADNTFDFVLSADVFEHIPEPYLAHQEVHRILVPGGRHVFTVPSSMDMPLDDQRAMVGEAGIEYFAEPEYHGGNGHAEVLVYTVFGAEMLGHLGALGFTTRVAELHVPPAGVLGPGVVYEAVKTHRASGRPVPTGRRLRQGESITGYTPRRRLTATCVLGDGVDVTSALTALEAATDVVLDVVLVTAGARPTDLPAGVRLVDVPDGTDQEEAFLLGASAGATDLVLLLTADVVVSPEALRTLMAVMTGPDAPYAAIPTVRIREEDPAAAGPSAGLNAPGGVCVLIDMRSDGGDIRHVADAVITSAALVSS